MSNGITSNIPQPEGIEEICIGAGALEQAASQWEAAGLTRADALNEAFDTLCLRAGGHFIRSSDVAFDGDGYAIALGWRQ